MSFESVLGGFLEAPGVLAAAFLDPQGAAIAQVGDPDAVELVGAYQSVWLSEMGRAAARSGLGELSELALDFASRRVISAEVKDRYFLLVILSPDGLLAPVRARLPEARRDLAREI